MNSRLLMLLVAGWLLLLKTRPCDAQSYRGLLHWKRDLEYRLKSYARQQNVIADILATSLTTGGGSSETINGPARVSAEASNVRFSDLIIPSGSLILDSQIASPSVRIMANKTNSYVNSKSNELFQIESQLESIKIKLQDPNRNLIYKGLPPNQGPPMIPNMINITRIPGIRLFKQFNYGHIIRSTRVTLKHINFTNVDQVLTDTYMENPKFGVRDSQQRLFFEGRKTFWRTVFARSLKSGCCDRLKPIHTSRMMTRSSQQDIQAPVLFQNIDQLHGGPKVSVRNLFVPKIHNRLLVVKPPTNRPLNDNGLVPSLAENFIQPSDLINIKQLNRTILPKTLVFKNALFVEKALLGNSYPENRTFIGTGVNQTRFDLALENYLLKTFSGSEPYQRVEGSVMIKGATSFFSNIDSNIVNGIPNFREYATSGIVKIDRPAIIHGSVQFDAMPYMFNQSLGPAKLPQNVLIMNIDGGLNVGLVNGMQLPRDIVLIPQPPFFDNNQTEIIIHGSRNFANQAMFEAPVTVRKNVNNIQMPEGVIPLQWDDNPIGYLGKSNLLFVEGIVANDLLVQSGRFDDLKLNTLYGDAQSFIVNSILIPQPDGSHIINAPLKVVNLQLRGNGPNQGLLNGFRPDNILELSARPQDHLHTIYGHKTFMAPVEVADCLFGEINQLANWTSHLIRIDRPNTVQIIHSKLLFTNPPLHQEELINYRQGPPPVGVYNKVSSVDIVKFKLDFYPNNNRNHYITNLNLSPEFYIIHRALARGIANYTEIRVRANQIILHNPYARINGITLNDIVTLDAPFRFVDRFVMVGKVDILGSLKASRITSNYPIDVMDLVQFNRYRIPITGSHEPIRLNSLVFSTNNRASFVQCLLLNGISFNQFANSIMSLTRQQVVDSRMTFLAPINLEGVARTENSLNGIQNFKSFAKNLKSARYILEDGLQCNSVIVKEN